MNEIIRLVNEFTAAQATLETLKAEKDRLVAAREKLRLDIDDLNARLSAADQAVTDAKAALRAAL